MRQTQRRFLALVPALALVTGLAVAAHNGGGNGGGNICVIGGDIVACVPPNDSPSSTAS